MENSLYCSVFSYADATVLIFRPITTKLTTHVVQIMNHDQDPNAINSLTLNGFLFSEPNINGLRGEWRRMPENGSAIVQLSRTATFTYLNKGHLAGNLTPQSLRDLVKLFQGVVQGRWHIVFTTPESLSLFQIFSAIL